MTDGEKELLWLIQNYAFNSKRLAEIEERLRSKTYSVTPSYSNTGGGKPNGNRSKVADYVEKVDKLRKSAGEYQRQLMVAEAAMRCDDLTSTEERLLRWIASGMRLASFADLEGIYISKVYKLRDKAIRKALRHLETTNRVKFRVKS